MAVKVPASHLANSNTAQQGKGKCASVPLGGVKHPPWPPLTPLGQGFIVTSTDDRTSPPSRSSSVKRGHLEQGWKFRPPTWPLLTGLCFFHGVWLVFFFSEKRFAGEVIDFRDKC